MNRCIAFNKNDKRCRAKCGNKLFCCDEHEPINKDLLTKGCFVCSEKIILTNELIYFRCKHCFHKSCFTDFLKYSTYNNPICLICRNEVFKKEIKEKKNKNKNSEKDYSEIKKIHNIVFNY